MTPAERAQRWSDACDVEQAAGSEAEQRGEVAAAEAAYARSDNAAWRACTWFAVSGRFVQGGITGPFVTYNSLN